MRICLASLLRRASLPPQIGTEDRLDSISGTDRYAVEGTTHHSSSLQADSGKTTWRRSRHHSFNRIRAWHTATKNSAVYRGEGSTYSVWPDCCARVVEGKNPGSYSGARHGAVSADRRYARSVSRHDRSRYARSQIYVRGRCRPCLRPSDEA